MVYKIICFRISLYHIFGYLTIILYKISLQHKKNGYKAAVFDDFERKLLFFSVIPLLPWGIFNQQ